MAKKKATKKATKKAAPKKATKKAAPKKATKKAAPKTATKKVAAKAKKAAAPKKAKSKRKPNAAFMRALTPSSALAAVVGSSPLPRTEVIKRIWAYIKKHNLQHPVNRRNIVADDALRAVFGKGEVTMFEMTKLVSNHLK
jgi:chromatin remodeling complex protein RSC6